MENFKLIDIRNIRKINKYLSNVNWNESALLPYFKEGYVCFARKNAYSFEDLMDMFFDGNENEQIGAISFIAAKFPDELYRVICEENNKLSKKKVRFLLECVVHSYLPLIIPKEKMMTYTFSEEYSDDIWVKMLNLLRLHM